MNFINCPIEQIKGIITAYDKINNSEEALMYEQNHHLSGIILSSIFRVCMENLKDYPEKYLEKRTTKVKGNRQ